MKASIERGVLFGNIHSFYDLNLVLSSVSIPPAKPKTNYIEIPGGDGSIDLTEAQGEIRYYDRDGCKFVFTVNPNETDSFEVTKTKVANALNGQRFDNIILDKDQEYFYSGRCVVNEWLQDRNLKQIVVTATLSPYKQRINETVVAVTLTDTPQEVVLMNGRKPVVPLITCTGETVIKFYPDPENSPESYVKVTTSACTNKQWLDFYLNKPTNVFEVYGEGTITFTYREGDL